MAAVQFKPLPPKEAIRYFQSKGFKIGFDYRDVWQEEHQASFTVAKAMSVDLLQDIRAGVEKALTEGKSLEAFRKELTPLLQARGWWGKQEMTDPLTGVTREVQLGSPQRLQTIFTTNVRRAYAEGQWDRVQESAEDFPFLQYDGNNSAHPRLQHSAWDNMVLPVNDPFWESHFPPRGYNCKCRVIQLTEGMMKNRGLKVSPSPQVPNVEYINKRTGEVEIVPKGVHPAFHFKMGEGRAKLNGALVEKLNQGNAQDARAVAGSIVSSKDFAEWYRQVPPDTTQKPSSVFYPVAVIGEALQQQLGTKAQTVILSDWTVGKQKARHPEIAPKDYVHVQRVIDTGEALQDSENTVTMVLNEADGFVAVVKAIKTGKEVFLASFYRLSRDQAERDRTMRRLVRKSEKGKGGGR